MGSVVWSQRGQALSFLPEKQIWPYSFWWKNIIIQLEVKTQYAVNPVQWETDPEPICSDCALGTGAEVWEEQNRIWSAAFGMSMHLAEVNV